MALWTLTPERRRALRRSAANSVFGFVVFVVTLYIWFPYDRARDVAIAMAAAQGLDVEIGSVGRAFGFGVTFRDIIVRTHPPSGKPTRFTIEAARVTVSPLSLLGSSPSVTIDADAFGGNIVFEQTASKQKAKGPFTVGIKVSSLNLAELPGVKEAINLPLGGTLALKIDLSSASGRYADTVGAISFQCEACVVGDGHTPLRVEGNPFLAGGLTLPRVRLGNLSGRVAVEKGLAKLQGVGGKSADGELSLEGESQLRDPLNLSSINFYLRFKLSDALLKSAERLATILQMAATQGKRPDGSYGVRLSGTFANMAPPVFTTASQFGGPSPPPRPAGRPGIAPRPAPPPPPAAIPSPSMPAPSAPPPAAPAPVPASDMYIDESKGPNGVPPQPMAAPPAAPPQPAPPPAEPGAIRGAPPPPTTDDDTATPPPAAPGEGEAEQQK
ncbi:MAG TPA: type II secretion system protein GspN [Polyangia bacterium]|jgi:type II secretion system protein N|nr:type II secretion system protein GspN [Polyangia bacterium]